MWPFPGCTGGVDLSSERLLFVPAEGRTSVQAGPRKAFRSLLDQGGLGAYDVSSINADVRSGTTMAAGLKQLLHLAEAFAPTIVLWQHPARLPLSRSALQELKAVGSRPTLGYHEGDGFGWVRQRLPRGCRALAAEADIVFLEAMGRIATLFRLVGAKKVLYVPASVDTVRFGFPWEPTPRREFDVVMIANRVISRNPFGGIPGADGRVRLARALTSLLGDRFALFGRGWEGLASNRGPLPFADAEAVNRRAWLTVGWDAHDRVPYYFSNRVPIAMLSGVAHLTNRQPGYDNLFTNGYHLFLADRVGEAVALVGDLLECPRERLVAVGRQGQSLARRSLTADVTYARMLERLVEHRRADAGARAAVHAHRTT